MFYTILFKGETTEGKESTVVTKPVPSNAGTETERPGGVVKGSTSVPAPVNITETPQGEASRSTTEPLTEGGMGGTKTPSPEGRAINP